jgi:hypothetical protein
LIWGDYVFPRELWDNREIREVGTREFREFREFRKLRKFREARNSHGKGLQDLECLLGLLCPLNPRCSEKRNELLIEISNSCEIDHR